MHKFWCWFLGSFEKFDDRTLSIFNTLISMIIGFSSFIIAILGIFYAVRQYRLKRSIKISSSYGLSSTIYYRDTYIKSVTLQNLKDKSEAIFGVYFRLGANYYICLEDLEDSPIIIQPFETITRKYNPVTFYGCNQYRLNINKYLNDKRYLKKSAIVLSTPHGKYITKKEQKYWHPILNSLKNKAVAPIESIQVQYTHPRGTKHTAPTNVQYIITYSQNGEMKADFIQNPKLSPSFSNSIFQVTSKELETKETLETYLKKMNHLQNDEDIDLSSIKVIDVERIPEMKRMKTFYNNETECAPSKTRLILIYGFILTMYDRYKIKRLNYNQKKPIYTYNELLFLKTFTVFILLVLFSSFL